MRKRWLLILSIVVAVILVVGGGLLLALRLTTPALPDTPIATEQKELPAAWIETGRDLPAGSPEEPNPEVAATPLESTQDVLVFSTNGTLALFGDGRPFGEEAYELELTEGEMALRSRGRFRFRIVVATINVAFEQELLSDAALNPSFYKAVFHAPLGRDREIESVFSEGAAVITEGGRAKEIEVPEDTIVLGTFSTYALLPIAFALREEDGVASFEILVFGGPPEQETEEEGSSWMVVARLPATRIRANGQVLSVDAYSITSALGESLLLAKGLDFLAFVAGDEEESFLAYRSDFFPDGFEILDSPEPSS
ncbi:hypothetical protein ACFLTM_04335 [Candidatus Bipolaricaulota bacterium]